MPWVVSVDGRCPSDAPWGVQVQNTGELVACHATKDKAVAQQKALYATQARSPDMTKLADRSVPVRAEMEFRATPSGGTNFTGYAAVFDSDSEPMPFVESIAPGSFTRTLGSRTNHTFVLNHNDELLLASRNTGRLRLAQDSKGLLVDAELPNTSYANDLRALHEAGEVWGMSFTFRAAKNGQEWSPDMSRRRLTDVSLGHVTALAGLQPAYGATAGTTQIRSLAKAVDAEGEDIEGLATALLEGRTLSDEEIALFLRLAAHLGKSAPADTTATEEPQGRSVTEMLAALAERGY